MNTQIISNSKHISTRLSVVLLAVLVLLSACERHPQPTRVEEITFRSGEFTLVGDLLLPDGRGPFPVILFLEGSGPNDRYGWWPVQERILRAGYATFIWDAPGLGESTGSYNGQLVIIQRAQILLAAIDAVKEHPEIARQRIGLLGQSQGGWVIARALAQTDEVAFMICISCPGMSGNDEMAYQIARMATCDDLAAEAEPKIAAQLAGLQSAAEYDTYEEYQRYWEVLGEMAELASADLEGRHAASPETWEVNPLEPVTTWDPVQGIARTGIPILAIFGDRDRNLDPYRGAYAWEQELARGGHPQSRLTVFPGVDHSMFPSQTGCPAEMGQLLEQYARSKGYGSTEELLQAFQQDPYQPGVGADFPWAPEVLDQVDAWLRDLQP
jgi:pimeloyl-ACP methyl ester carboxylesterase